MPIEFLKKILILLIEFPCLEHIPISFENTIYHFVDVYGVFSCCLDKMTGIFENTLSVFAKKNYSWKSKYEFAPGLRFSL